MKDFVIKVVDTLSVIVMVIAIVIALIAVISGAGGMGVVTAIAVVAGSCLTVGFWMVLSRLLDVQKEILTQIKKEKVV